MDLISRTGCEVEIEKMGLIIGPRKAIALWISEEIKLISNEEKRQMVSQDKFKNSICGVPLIKSNRAIRKKT